MAETKAKLEKIKELESTIEEKKSEIEKLLATNQNQQLEIIRLTDKLESKRLQINALETELCIAKKDRSNLSFALKNFSKSVRD